MVLFQTWKSHKVYEWTTQKLKMNYFIEIKNVSFFSVFYGVLRIPVMQILDVCVN